MIEKLKMQSSRSTEQCVLHVRHSVNAGNGDENAELPQSSLTALIQVVEIFRNGHLQLPTLPATETLQKTRRLRRFRNPIEDVFRKEYAVLYDDFEWNVLLDWKQGELDKFKGNMAAVNEFLSDPENLHTQAAKYVALSDYKTYKAKRAELAKDPTLQNSRLLAYMLDSVSSGEFQVVAVGEEADEEDESEEESESESEESEEDESEEEDDEQEDDEEWFNTLEDIPDLTEFTDTLFTG